MNYKKIDMAEGDKSQMIKLLKKRLHNGDYKILKGNIKKIRGGENGSMVARPLVELARVVSTRFFLHEGSL